MPLLPPSEIPALVAAAIACELARPERRDLLFTGLPREILARIAHKERPADQVETDLIALAALEGDPQASGLSPLAVWLDNARRHAGARPEAAVFATALGVLDATKAAAVVALRAQYRPGTPIPATDDALDRALEKRPILWVGAGLSVGAGYPSTGHVIEALRKRAEPGDIPAGVDEFTAVVDAFVAAMGEGALHNVLDDLFATPRAPTAVHHALARLAAQGMFSAIITTNYDDLLEHALADAGVATSVQVLQDNAHLQPSPDKLIVAKIHGSRQSWQDAIFSGDSYARFHERYGFLTRLLDVWMTQYPFVFVGCSMQDPRLIDWLRARAARNAPPLNVWRPMMTASDWQAAWDAAPDALGRAEVRPLVIDDYQSHLPKLWSDAARRHAPRLDKATLERHLWRAARSAPRSTARSARSKTTTRRCAVSSPTSTSPTTTASPISRASGEEGAVEVGWRTARTGRIIRTSPGRCLRVPEPE